MLLVCCMSLKLSFSTNTAPDPEVSTLTTLTNVQNSLFVPNLGRFLNRRPTYNLTRGSTAGGSRPATAEPPVDALPITHEETEDSTGVVRPRLTHTSTISSTLSESRYAVLPHGETLYGWTPEEKAELNDLVRHMLHSKRAAFKRGMKGFGQYIRRRMCRLPRFVAVYANTFQHWDSLSPSTRFSLPCSVLPGYFS